MTAGLKELKTAVKRKIKRWRLNRTTELLKREIFSSSHAGGRLDSLTQIRCARFVI